MRKAVILLALGLVSAAANAQNVPAGFDLTNYGVRIEPDRRIIAVLATIDAARDPRDNSRIVNTRLSPAGAAFRSRLETELSVPDDLRQKISVFISQYKKTRPGTSDAELVVPFIAMAHSLSPAPDLADPVVTGDLPGELLDVLDFAPLVREFYRRSGISARMDGYVKDHLKAADTRLRGSAREMVSELLNYLHTRPQTIYAERVRTETQKSRSKSTLNTTEIRERERRFFIVPEMLAPADNIQFLNIRDDYFVVVPPDTDLSETDVRRAFLQYVVDGIILLNAKDVASVRPGVKQLLDERRKASPNISPDAYLAVARSLVAAIDAREAEYAKTSSATYLARQKIATLKSDGEKRAVSAELERFKQAQADETALRLSEDYEKGAVLAFYFAAQLRGLEDSGFDIAASMRDMLLTFDAAKEMNRLAEFADARRRAAAARAARKSGPPQTIASPVENPVTTALMSVQDTIAARNFSKAETDLNALLATAPDDPRVHYNLGRVYTLQAEGLNDAELQARKLVEAKKAYANVIGKATQSTDKALLSLTYVALARIYEFGDDRDYAVRLYEKAIELSDIPGGAYAQAIDGKQRLLKQP